MSDFDFITHRESDFRYFHGSRKDNVSHGRNPHPLQKAVRDQMEVLGREHRYWERKERRLRKKGGEFWVAMEKQKAIEAELRRLGSGQIYYANRT